MKRFLLIAAVAIFCAVSPVDAGVYGESVSIEDLKDRRTFGAPFYNASSSQGGLNGNWPYSFTIEWDISYDFNTLLWTYEYRLSSIRRDVSHFILELSPGTELGDFMDFMVNGKAAVTGSVEGTQNWGRHPSNPFFPEFNFLYGIKFDVGSSDATYSYTTKNDPVWGNFYAKSGKHEGEWIYAFNNVLQKPNFESDDILDFIVRPNGGSSPPIVPEPLSAVLFFAGGSVFIMGFFRKNKQGI